jgi:hypothetical protein
VTGLMPENDGELGYRIKHPGEDFERVAMETELSASEPEHSAMITPVPRIRCTKAMN